MKWLIFFGITVVSFFIVTCFLSDKNNQKWKWQKEEYESGLVPFGYWLIFISIYFLFLLLASMEIN